MLLQSIDSFHLGMIVEDLILRRRQEKSLGWIESDKWIDWTSALVDDERRVLNSGPISCSRQGGQK